MPPEVSIKSQKTMINMINAKKIHVQLRTLSNLEHAKTLGWFFKTGPGQYGEGDKFVGIKVPVLRKLAKECRALPLAEVKCLLHCKIHEARMLALMILVLQAAGAEDKRRREIYDFYLANTKWINNWTWWICRPAIGRRLSGAQQSQDSLRLAKSKSLWNEESASWPRFLSSAKEIMAIRFRSRKSCWRLRRLDP